MKTFLLQLATEATHARKVKKQSSIFVSSNQLLAQRAQGARQNKPKMMWHDKERGLAQDPDQFTTT